MTRLPAILFVLFAFGCGSSEPATSTAPAAAEQPAGSKAEHEHPRLTPELDAFHGLLSPLWHADKGEARMKDTCAAVDDFQAKAAAVKAAAAPAAVEAASWSSAGTNLEGAVAGLTLACAGSAPEAFETALEAVHTRFHQAMELVAAKPEASGQDSGW